MEIEINGVFYTLMERQTEALEKLAKLLEKVVDDEKNVVRMVDVDRANVYSTHLGKKLSEPKEKS